MQVDCPHCAGAVEVELADHLQRVACPHCGGEMELPALPTDGTILDDRSADQRPRLAEADLDANRIRQVSKMRRSAIRSRSWCLIGGVLCLALFGQSAWNAVGVLRDPGRSGLLSVLVAAAWALGAVLSAAGAVWMYRRSEHFQAEAAKSALSAPDQPPDFTPLSDGSQSWKNLEQIDPK